MLLDAGAYGVMVSTAACGAVCPGSNPGRHPKLNKNTPLGVFLVNRSYSVGGVPSGFFSSSPSARKPCTISFNISRSMRLACKRRQRRPR